MEHSTNSSMNQPLSSNGATGSPEESGWTDYFEDFFSNNRDQYSGTASSPAAAFRSTSLISDAASCAACKLSDSDNHANRLMERQERGSKKLSFKKKKRVCRGVSDDDDALEDTASSPVNSPKISDLRKLDTNPRKKDVINSEVSQDRIRSPNDHFSELHTDHELKKRGLCLVPLSMLMNYLG